MCCALMTFLKRNCRTTLAIFRTVGYGMTRFADLFTNRQLTALATFTILFNTFAAASWLMAVNSITPMQSLLTLASP